MSNPIPQPIPANGSPADSGGPPTPLQPRSPKTARILAGLGLGAVLGATANFLAGGTPTLTAVVRYVTEPAGQIWLRALFMIVIPLVFATLSLGVAKLAAVSRLGRIGLKTLLFFVVTSGFAAIVGMTMIAVFHPGSGISPETRARLLENYQHGASEPKAGAAAPMLGVDTVVNIVPRNPLAAAVENNMLGIIFFSLVFGLALGLVPAVRSHFLIEVLRGLADVMMAIIDLVMKLAPFGVFALLFSVAAKFGFHLLEMLAGYVVVVVTGLLIFEVGFYGILLRWLARRNPLEFFRGGRVAVVTAFSTGSSNATLPTTIRVSETDLGLPPEICGFVLPLGAAMNKNGTALFEGAAILFISQVLGIPLHLPQLAVVFIMTILTAGVGTAGVPSAVIPLMIPVLAAVGIPSGGIALIVGVDIIIEMCRTVVNVSGHMVATAVVARTEINSAPGNTGTAGK